MYIINWFSNCYIKIDNYEIKKKKSGGEIIIFSQHT